MLRLFLLSVVLCLNACPLACAQSASEKQTAPQTQEKPSPLTPEQQELYLLRKEGIAAYHRGDSPKAEKAYQAGLEKAQALKDERWIAQFLNNLGIVYHSLGQLEKSLDFFTRALAVKEKLGNAQDIAYGLNNLGNVYNSLGQFEKALDFHTHALVLKEKLGNPQSIAASLTGLGLVYFHLGQFEKALDFYSRALMLYEKLGDEQDIAGNLDNLGLVYSHLGQLEEALDFHHRALVRREKLGNEQDIAASLTSLGNVYFHLGQFEKSRDFFTRSLDLKEKLGNPRDIAASLTGLGNVYFSLGQFEKALDFHHRARAFFEKLGNEQDVASSFNNLGNVYLNLGKLEEALDFHHRALVSHKKLGNEQDIALSLTNLGNVYSHMKRFDNADHAFQQAIGHYERLLAQVSDTTQLGSLQNGYQGNPYLAYAAFLVEQHHPALALEYAERGRGQGLARLARQNHTDLAAFFSPADASARRQQQEELTTASALWQAAKNRPIPSDKAEQQALLEQQQQAEQRYRKAETDWTVLEASLRLKYPRYRQLQGFAPPSPAQLAALARHYPDTLFIASAVIQEKISLLFALSRQGLKAFSPPLGDKTFSTLAADWKRALLTNSSEEPALAQQVGRTILAPLEKSGLLQPKRFSHLVVVADGPLLDIPFAALMDSKGKRLVERFAVSSVFSLGSLLWPQEKRQATRTLLCAADPTGDGNQAVSLASRGGKFIPLSAAREEVHHLLPLFAGTKTVAYFGKEAQRERIQQQMSQYALLHFATHGIADGTIGLRSGLLLADDKAEEKYSILEARDIVSMKLSAQLAVLSACETAEGQKSGGDGLLGLAWAFRAAGCPCIVASQWNVDDAATGQLMLAFYKALKAGKRKDDALRQAMLTVKKLHPAPKYWAAFQVIGDTQPLHLISEKSAPSKRCEQGVSVGYNTSPEG